jgi:hypothetical protein
MLYNPLNDFDTPRKPVTPAEAAGRALHRIEHPTADTDVWDSVDDYTRAWWTAKAQPMTDAILALLSAMTDCEADQRNLQALHQLELDWGSGTFNYTNIRRILTGTEKCTNHDTTGKMVA